MSHFGDKRDGLNRAKPSVVCNASATNSQITLDFSAVFGYPNVNLGYPRDNQKRISKCLQTLETPYVSGVFRFSGNIVECRETG